MKIINIDSKIRWKITQSEAGFVAVSERIKLTVEAKTKEELILNIQDSMSALFRQLHEDKSLNKYAFSHSIAYTISEQATKTGDIPPFLDIAPPPIIVI